MFIIHRNKLNQPFLPMNPTTTHELDQQTKGKGDKKGKEKGKEK